MRHLSGFIAFGHGKDTGAGDLHDTDRFECVEENGDAFGCVAHLDHHLIAGHIYNARAHDLTVIHNIPAVSTVVFDLYKQKLAVDALRLIKGLDFDDIQFFVELFFDLLEGPLIAGADDDHTGHFSVIRLTDCDGVDVETAAPEKAGSLTENTGAVLDQNRIYSLH